jgi:hypothetical protein
MMVDGFGEPARDQAFEFEKEAARGRVGLLAEFTDFLLHNKKWWLTPIIIVLLAASALIVLGSTGAAPFIYTLF